MSRQSLRVLLLGSGGREHSLVKACMRSSLVAEVIAAPGNGGMSQDVRTIPVDVMDPEAVLGLTREEKIDFVIIGPEGPLSVGLADVLEEAGIPTYGTNRAATQLEASKAFCKDFLERHQIPTARYATFTDARAAEDYLRQQSNYPIVIKASGLATGKGVIIATSEEEAIATIHGMLDGSLFGASGREIVIEEFMQGEEASIMLMVCRDRYMALPPSQDHKRIGEGDQGPNTGGMGAYAPAGVVTPEIDQAVRRRIIEPTLRGLLKEGIDFRGTLYVGVMITPEGPKVVEFNTRFGDPETQVLLPLCAEDPIALLYACATGELESRDILTHKGSAVVVVLATEGYPGSYEKGLPITLPDSLPPDVEIIHAGTRSGEDGILRTAGGRVLGVVARSEDLRQAAQLAYQVCEQISWEGKYYRRDIGFRELARASSTK